jgi:hypothetical protein
MSIERPDVPDPAAVFGAALSLWQQCHKHAAEDSDMNLSESYHGFDQFMREVMRVATQFETWACNHVNFDELDEVWPYMIEDKFGEQCLSVILPTGLATFEESDCLRVAMRMRLPIINYEKLPLPVNLIADNPTAGSQFKKFRIQTVRNHIDGDGISAYTWDDEPFDDNYDWPYFSLYGIGEDGLLEHIADRTTCDEAMNLARNHAPGIKFSSPNKSSPSSVESV